MNVRKKIAALFLVFLMVFGNMPLALAEGTAWSQPGAMEHGMLPSGLGTMAGATASGASGTLTNDMTVWTLAGSSLTRDALENPSVKYIIIKTSVKVIGVTVTKYYQYTVAGSSANQAGYYIAGVFTANTTNDYNVSVGDSVSIAKASPGSPNVSQFTVFFDKTKKVYKGNLTVQKVVTGPFLTEEEKNAPYSFRVVGPIADPKMYTITASAAANGTKELPYGSYTIAETGVSDDFKATLSADSFTIDAEHTSVSIVATNTKQAGVLTVDKTIAVDKPSAVLAGVGVTEQDKAQAFHFTVVGPAPATTEWTLDASQNANGKLSLPYGSYTIAEVSIPAEYSSSPLMGSAFTLSKWNPTVTMHVVNAKLTGLLTLRKALAGEGIKELDRFYPFQFKITGPSEDPKTWTVFASDSMNGLQPLPYGDYTIEEMNIPDGFLPSFDRTAFTIGPDSPNVTLTATNTRKLGSVGITKALHDVTDGARSGQSFVFSLERKDSKGEFVPYGSAAGVDNGATASFTGLPWGEYRISETPVSGFPLLSISGDGLGEGNTFTVDREKQEFAFTATNDTPKGQVTITKAIDGVDSETPTGQSFVFRLLRKAGGEFVPYATAEGIDNGGVASFGDLPWGQYRIEEDAVEGYPLLSITGDGIHEDHTFSVGPDAMSFAFTATNDKPLGAVLVTKAVSGLDSKTRTGKSFVFRLLKDNGDGEYTTYDTADGVDNGGVANFDGLPWGRYRIAEDAVAGFPLLSITGSGLGEGHTFVVGPAQQSFAFTATNNAPKGEVTITKAIDGVDSETPTGQSFVFRLLRKAGGEFVPYATAEGVDNGGMALFGELPWGQYRIEEDPVEGYPLLSITGEGLHEDNSFTIGMDSTHFAFTATNDKPLGTVRITKAVSGLDSKTPTGKSFVFHLLKSNGDGGYADYGTAEGVDNGGEVTFGELPWGRYQITEDAVTDYPLLSITGSGLGEGYTFVVGPAQQSFDLTATNDKPLGRIAMSMVVLGAGELPTGQGVTFSLYRKGETMQLASAKLAPALTTAVATLTLDNGGTGSFADLPWGTYYLRQTGTPAGFEFVSLSSGGATITDPDQALILAVDGSAQTAKVSAVNRKLGNVKIVKTDAATGAKLAGAEFSLADNAAFTGAITLTTAADGTVTSAALKPGQWFLKETKAPAGYELDATVRTVTIIQGQTTEAPVTNALTVGALRLIKVDAANTQTTLPGAAFNLYADAALTKLAASGLTDAKGEINIDKLVPGAYWAVETAAPTGYKLDASPVSLTITGNNRTILTIQNIKDETKAFTDEKAVIKLLKVDGYSQKALEGAKFNLYSDAAHTALVATGVTDANGLIQWSDLSAGVYYVVETAAPKGYKLNATAVSVTAEAGKTATVTIADELDDTKDYQTGSMDYNILIGGGAVLLLGGLLLLFTRRRKSKKN